MAPPQEDQTMFGKLLAGCALCALMAAPAFAGDTYVHSYIRKDGTYVQGYHRTTPNSSRYDNYSTKGNMNPWTGKAGTENPYPATSPYGSTHHQDRNGYEQPNTYGY
jgi:hypothetical protein